MDNNASHFSGVPVSRDTEKTLNDFCGDHSVYSVRWDYAPGSECTGPCRMTATKYNAKTREETELFSVDGADDSDACEKMAALIQAKNAG